ncbi:polysaccharide deacetylase family protein [Candidatus Arthromitus sp. SFB-mouse]|uniref:polysaccharide deacetylase family protein n=1 Tax=Candidatus Arthromitus sp. SFB-mouse TaxID=49118 RepID=UPI00022967A5|nr:polysaccharide deacetylase family protein [Candidatus Arthromitus sp. SFB-mouse]EGX29280.1 putative polysaccharide deacetylase [Candidatus Arthromitus sp. SFB-mouse-NYU]BAK79392.1 polysaccharide deacetylase [Candidatus Arthromitus sp. SFB-mouse-Yit]
MKLKILFNCTIIALFFVCFTVFYSKANVVDKFIYSPKDIMEGQNTTIEGGRFSYDSMKVQKNLFNAEKINNGEKTVFLTFDDGPSLDNTPKVLEVLKNYDVKATFFVLGVNLDRGEEYRQLLRNIVNDGHAVGNHGYSHNYSYLYPGRVISYENLMSDMNRSLDIMKDILGQDFDTRVLRLPGGLRSWKKQDETLERLNNENYSVIEWNAMSGDVEGKNIKDPDVLFQKAIDTAGNSKSVVMLMHDFSGSAGEVSSRALPKIINYFKENGYEFRTLY